MLLVRSLQLQFWLSNELKLNLSLSCLSKKKNLQKNPPIQKRTLSPHTIKQYKVSPKCTHETQHKNKHIWPFSSSSAATSKEKGKVIREMLENEGTKCLLLCLYTVTFLKSLPSHILARRERDFSHWWTVPGTRRKWTNTFFYVYRWPDALICELMHPLYPGVRERGRERKKWRQLPKLATSPSSWICWTTLKSIHIGVE